MAAQKNLRVGTISAVDHLKYAQSRNSVSFLQLPSWALVKSEWRHESLGWFKDDELVGTALVLLRAIPRTKRYLAYIPEGPDIDWEGAVNVDGVKAWLEPMVVHLKARGAFAVKMGPQVWARQWSSTTLKNAMAETQAGSARRLSDITADSTNELGLNLVRELRTHGWRQESSSAFGDVQPRYVFQVPLENRTQEDMLSGFNQLWRRNIKKAAAAGVQVRLGSRDDLEDFHRIYLETAQRDSFRPRPLSYFQRMWDALTTEDPTRIRLYLAEHDGQLLAAATAVNVGSHSWYSYGASTTQGRELRPSNAMQWHMMCDALNDGRKVYDMRGITDTLDPENPLIGLLQFKVGTGGQAIEYVGEWDKVLRPIWNFAVNQWLKRR